MLTVEAGSGWWLTSPKRRLEEKETRQCVWERDSTTQVLLLSSELALNEGEKWQNTPLNSSSFCLSGFPYPCIFVSLLSFLLTLPIVTFLSRAANTKAKWLYMLYSSCIKWECDRCITCCPWGIYRNFNNNQDMLLFFTLLGPFCPFVTVYTCMNVVSNIQDIFAMSLLYMSN